MRFFTLNSLKIRVRFPLVTSKPSILCKSTPMSSLYWNFLAGMVSSLSCSVNHLSKFYVGASPMLKQYWVLFFLVSLCLINHIFLVPYCWKPNLRLSLNIFTRIKDVYLGIYFFSQNFSLRISSISLYGLIKINTMFMKTLKQNLTFLYT